MLRLVATHRKKWHLSDPCVLKYTLYNDKRVRPSRFSVVNLYHFLIFRLGNVRLAHFERSPTISRRCFNYTIHRPTLFHWRIPRPFYAHYNGWSGTVDASRGSHTALLGKQGYSDRNGRYGLFQLPFFFWFKLPCLAIIYSEGDDKQLGPTIHSQQAGHHGLHQSIMEHLANLDVRHQIAVRIGLSSIRSMKAVEIPKCALNSSTITETIPTCWTCYPNSFTSVNWYVIP